MSQVGNAVASSAPQLPPFATSPTAAGLPGLSYAPSSPTGFATPVGLASPGGVGFGVQPARYGTPYMGSPALSVAPANAGRLHHPTLMQAPFENPPSLGGSPPSTLNSYESVPAMMSPSNALGQPGYGGQAAFESMVVYGPSGQGLPTYTSQAPPYESSASAPPVGLINNESMIAYPGYPGQASSPAHMSSDTYTGRVKGVPAPEPTKVTKKKIGCCTSAGTEVKPGKRKGRAYCCS